MATTSTRTKKAAPAPDVATSTRTKKSTPDVATSTRTKKATATVTNPSMAGEKTAMEKSAPVRSNELEVSMESVTFVCKPDKKSFYVDLPIKNKTEAEMAFKVRCNSQEIFRVLPPSGFLKPAETLNLRIWFQNKGIPPALPKHYFAIYYYKKEEGKDLKELMALATKTNRVQRLPAIFQAVEANN